MLAVLFFTFAALVDSPFPRWPNAEDKLMGNFTCSCGFLCLAIALLSWE